MPNHTNFSGKSMIPRSLHWVLLALFSVFLLVPAAWGAGLWLYESGGPDLGTAGAGRAALAADASTAGSNPAGMTRLDRSQILSAVQGLYINSKFDTQSSGFGGGDGYAHGAAREAERGAAHRAGLAPGRAGPRLGGEAGARAGLGRGAGRGVRRLLERPRRPAQELGRDLHEPPAPPAGAGQDRSETCNG